MCVIKCHINLLLLVFLAIFKHVVTEDIENKSKSCFSLYEEGKHAYLENNFQLCVEKLQKSIEKYKAFTKSLENCRIKCKEEAEHSDPLYPINIENLNFYEKTIRNTLCIIKCRKSNEIFKETPSLTAEHENEFQIKKPYEYLHICYFQVSWGAQLLGNKHKLQSFENGKPITQTNGAKPDNFFKYQSVLIRLRNIKF